MGCRSAKHHTEVWLEQPDLRRSDKPRGRTTHKAEVLSDPAPSSHVYSPHHPSQLLRSGTDSLLPPAPNSLSNLPPSTPRSPLVPFSPEALHIQFALSPRASPNNRAVGRERDVWQLVQNGGTPGTFTYCHPFRMSFPTLSTFFSSIVLACLLNPKITCYLKRLSSLSLSGWACGMQKSPPPGTEPVPRQQPEPKQ